MAWSEERIHRWLARQPPRGAAGRRGLGHDAAVLGRLGGRLVSCVDQTLGGVHFEPGESGRRIGHKAAARALSDLAATGATPRALLLALSAPKSESEGTLRSILRAVGELGERHGAALVGGDLAARPGPLALAVTALGELSGRRRPVGRDRARPGQVVVATGACGGSRLGRHLRIQPRLREGRRLWELGATAMIDVSDGLALDLDRLARASGVAIDLERVPVHPDARKAARASGREARWHALHDGEDHELLAALSSAAADRALRKLEGLVRIGRVRRGQGLWLADGERRCRWDGRGGWRHGS